MRLRRRLAVNLNWRRGHRHVNELRVAERLITGYDDRP
jgi:hypothetical protein